MKGQPRILYSRQFTKQHDALPLDVREKGAKAIGLFRENILHPSLRLHKLSGNLRGLWSISIDQKYRVVFQPLKGNEYLFISVGTHAIYDKQ